eukprot:CAMPEP_0173344898 /NCGR_PEP_ID=MMETSP1144-20121109/11665_1 /TAXON_ID=483371 /ORGANISM="non described non described, Strain CCMP2298" /LENGTH=118 /DNA_ID=CAMNT_0014291947 /DNA_START=402 /DNA_END=758 /DNA_ORIENTATION=+
MPMMAVARLRDLAPIPTCPVFSQNMCTFFLRLDIDGIFVEHHRGLRGVKVVAPSEPADAYCDLLALEDHGLVGVVGHAQLEVAPGEGEARCPESFELGHFLYSRHVLWLRPMSQVSSW